jgi:hypothetical protein
MSGIVQDPLPCWLVGEEHGVLVPCARGKCAVKFGHNRQSWDENSQQLSWFLSMRHDWESCLLSHRSNWLHQTVSNVTCCILQTLKIQWGN